jgi:polygalacturonase
MLLLRSLGVVVLTALESASSSTRQRGGAMVAPLAGACNVRARGAAADNATDDTSVFAATILDPLCRIIVVPRGAYLIKPLPALSSNTELLLLPGATVQGWREVRSYPNATAEYYAQWNQNISDCFMYNRQRMCRAAPLFRADGATNISVRGGGTIDGSGPMLWYNTTQLCTIGSPSYAFSYDFWHLCRPLLVAFNSIINLRVDNITLLNGPYIHMGADAVGMEISRLTVSTAGWQCRGYSGAPNTDCVDISGMNIHVTDSSCHNGDDCWPLLPSWSNYSARGSAPPPSGTGGQVGLTANVLIENSVCRCGNGVRVMPGIGAPREGQIVNVTYRECMYGILGTALCMSVDWGNGVMMIARAVCRKYHVSAH